MVYNPSSNALPDSCYTCGGPADHSEAACQGDYYDEEEVCENGTCSTANGGCDCPDLQPEEFVDDRSHWQQYDEMPWNG